MKKTPQSSFLSILLNFPEKLHVCGELNSSDFSGSDVYIFTAIKGLFNEKKKVNLHSVAECLVSIGKLKDSGGLEYLEFIANLEHIPAFIDSYVSSIKSISKRENVKKMVKSLSTKVEGEFDPEKIIEYSQRCIKEIEKRESISGIEHISDSCNSFYDDLCSRMDNGGSFRMETGIPKIDQMFNGGLGRGELVVIAARPGMGKTALAMNIAQKMSKKYSVGFVSLEMSKNQLVSRLISSDSKICLSKIISGSLNENEIEKMGLSFDKLKGLNFYIDDNRNPDIDKLVSKIHRVKQERGIDLLIVDYVGLMKSKGHSNRVIEIGDITGKLKRLSLDLDICVIGISQLNRGLEQRENKVPRLSDLRESGALEQDADQVLMVYREEYYKPTKSPISDASILMRKNRHGATGSIEMNFHKSTTTFS